MKYLKSVGITFAAFWCMAFVYWCISQYCQQQGFINPLNKTGSVSKQWKECKLMRVSKPRPGDIFIILNKDGSGHCGFVERVEGNIIYTIEGNSNEDGSREGYEVCRKPGGRPISSITGFIRPVFKVRQVNIKERGVVPLSLYYLLIQNFLYGTFIRISARPLFPGL